MDQATLKVVIYYKSQDQQNYEGLKEKPANLMKFKQENCYSLFAKLFLKENNGCKSLKVENQKLFNGSKLCKY